MKFGIGILNNVRKSVFMRSVLFRVLLIFTIAVAIIASVAFTSFTSEIRKNILSDSYKRLALVEKTISSRMDEITSIAYNIGKDPSFYLEPVNASPSSGYEMSKMLARYVVGNSFIEHLAYCRTSEPDVIYISTGERSLSEFFTTSFGWDKNTVDTIISAIHAQTKTRIALFGHGDGSYFAYTYPLPQLSSKPQAHVLILIPVKAVEPLFNTLLINSNGIAATFDSKGEELYRMGDPNYDLPLDDFVRSKKSEDEISSPTGEKYVLQKVVSENNGWTYVSAIRQSDTLSGVANKQLVLIILLLILLTLAVFSILVSVAVQYKPISNLAAQVSKDSSKGALDERKVLSETIATLKDDSEQKRRYETAYYEAEAASKAKSAFLSSMSHDIRTPMNAIIGMTSIAMKHVNDPDYVLDCLEKVKTSSDYLLDIINNVLDMSRIESGRIPLSEEPLYIPALIDGAVALIFPGVEAKSQTLDVDTSGISTPAVIGDSVRLTQIFVNIMSNSVKFTPNGGKLALTATQTKSGGDMPDNYVFKFSDTGIGMSKEFINQVFDTFSRANGMDASGTEGTGLGMAIAKKLTELMGGVITCESELGRGTTFTVSIRLKPTDSQKAAELANSYSKKCGEKPNDGYPSLDLRGKRILLVEDNDMNRLIANNILSETGAETVEAKDGKEAVEAFKNHPEGYFDLILMDIQMPEMNGYQATAAIRSMDRKDAKTVIIYAMTANTFDEDVRLVKAAGMNGHIGKPYTPESVYKALGQALN